MRIDLMHKSSYGQCILGNAKLRIAISHSLAKVTSDNAYIPVFKDTRMTIYA